ncbi:hypothetical protein [Mangrovibacterium lignilyticum]|uniref:hypothetical protein n=1 Tax=Mangrovibacterium lignilyticum TaxID=2668052 RepID=UPI0013CF8BF8|nr:hypothetical protein [Mangrovibacterium lignilyticum]
MKIRTIIRLLTIAALLLFVIPSCVKEGPAGLDGQDGTAGADGVDGADGADGTAFCMECHSTTVVDPIKSELASSLHATGTSFAYAGGRESCSRCHSNEGFITFIETSAADTTTSSNSITCNACHSHGDMPTFQDEDGNAVFVRTTDPVELIIDPTITIDYGNASNLCANCHQPRTAAPTPDGDGNFEITSSHYGPHHGPQGTLLMGIGLYKFDGTATVPGVGAATHATAGCTTCHMYEGAHTFAEPYLDACAQCHGEVDDFDINGKQTEIEGLMDELAAILVTEGVLGDDGHVITGTYPVNVARGFYNYIAVEEDKSEGAHNPDYVIAILKNTIEALQ